MVSLPRQGILVIAPKRQPAHLGGVTVQLLGDFPVEGKLLELCEGRMTEVVVPRHELGLIVGSGEVDVFPLLCRR